MPELTDRFDKALFYSSVIGRALSEKINDLNLTARALATAALVIGAGGNEDEAISSLLLEPARRTPDQRVLSEVRALFGPDVLAILQDCLASDHRKIVAAGDYGVRRQLADRHPRSILVAMADSMVMAVALHSDLLARGSQAWTAFEASREDVLSHFELLVRTFGALRPGVLATHFTTLVSELLCAASPYSEEPVGGDEPLPFRPRIVSDED